jgi:ABC-2 type transport system ATP-binding protein
MGQYQAERPRVQNAIEIHGLSRRFGARTVFGDVDLSVPVGGFTALLGRCGSGKTTLLRVLVGFLRASRGAVRVLGLDPGRSGQHLRRRVGFVPEDLALGNWMRVRDHLRFLEPFYPTWNRAEETRLLELFGLDPRARIRRLSRAQRAKHGLLAALAHEPELLILDEPLVGLDSTSRNDFMDAVLGFLGTADRTVIVTSRALSHLGLAADRLVLLDEGRISLEGNMEDIRTRTARLRVTVAVGTEQWEPPGRPLIQYDGTDILLTYLDRQDHLEEWIRTDPTVLMVRHVPLDPGIADPASAAGAVREEKQCVSSP